MARPRDGDVEPPLVCQKAEASLYSRRMIAPYAVEDDNILLSPLEGIDCVHLHRVGKRAVLAATKGTKPIFNMANL